MSNYREIAPALLYLAVILLFITTGCASVSESEYRGYRVINHTGPDALRAAYRDVYGSSIDDIAGFVEFVQTNQNWECVIHAHQLEKPRDRACTLAHEVDAHCKPGLLHAAGYKVAYLGSIRHAANTHPAYDENGNRYRDCGDQEDSQE